MLKARVQPENFLLKILLMTTCLDLMGWLPGAMQIDKYFMTMFACLFDQAVLKSSHLTDTGLLLSAASAMIGVHRSVFM